MRHVQVRGLMEFRIEQQTPRRKAPQWPSSLDRGWISSQVLIQSEDPVSLRSRNGKCGGANPHKTVDVLNGAFKPKKTVVREHLRANAMSDRTREVEASKKAPVRLAKVRRAA